MTALDDTDGLLTASDPAPVEVDNPDGGSPVFLVCEHAGRAVPERLGDLGVAPADMDRHIAWDVGAGPVARLMAETLDATLVRQSFSRLVVDCNRPFEAESCVPPVSDGTAIPANRGLSEVQRRRRYDEIHKPFHDRVAALLDDRARQGRPTLLLAVHSYTRQLNGGPARPWHLGLLFNRDDSMARRLMPHLVSRASGLILEFNEPYSVDDYSDYTIPVHGEVRGVPHVLAEIRNSEIRDGAGQAYWAGLMCDALADMVDAMNL
ncbi:MAG: N-formylglutamate amidohydrolase [Hyphomicrobiales bacterium]